MKISIYKEFSFEAAHALDGYDGKCKNIHGHSYQLKIGVIGVPNDDKTSSTYGMVMDFTEIKALFKTKIEPLFDHRLLLHTNSRFKNLIAEDTSVRYVPYQPTCENMLAEIVEICRQNLSGKVSVYNVILRETSSSYAEWKHEMQ